MLQIYKEQLTNKGEIYLRLKITPNAPKTEILNMMDDNETIKMKVNAAPEKGKANAEIIKFLSKEFKVPKSHVSIVSGAKERVKLTKIKN